MDKQQTQSKPQLKTQRKFKKNDDRLKTIYSRCLLTRTVMLPVSAIGENLKETIDKLISTKFEGKCVVEGFIKSGSSKVITYSSGLVQGVNVSFSVVFECYVCCPVEGMNISCVAKNITTAGIRGESADESPSPIVVFIARDHHYSNKYFATIEEDAKFTARVIGQRFELNDKYVSVIAELVVPKVLFKPKPRLIINP